MADYCKACSIEIFGEDFRELAGLSSPEQTAKGLYPVVICEGCGSTQVDHDGACIATDHLKPDGSHKPHREIID